MKLTVAIAALLATSAAAFAPATPQVRSRIFCEDANASSTSMLEVVNSSPVPRMAVLDD